MEDRKSKEFRIRRQRRARGALIDESRRLDEIALYNAITESRVINKGVETV